MGWLFDLIDLVKQEQIVVYAVLASGLVLLLTIVTLLVIATVQGKAVSIFNIKIGSRSENIFKVISLASARNILDSGVNEYFAWNPSWQTELITDPGEWMDMHINRYLKKDINRVVYAIFDIETNRKDRKYYYKQSFVEFINRFVRANGNQLLGKMDSKMEVYVSNDLTSDITYFITKNKKDFYCAVIFINEEPFSKGGVPAKILYTENESMVTELKSNIETFIANAERIDIDSLLLPVHTL